MAILQIPFSGSLMCESEQNRFYYSGVQLSINHHVTSSDITAHKCLCQLYLLFIHSEFLILYGA